MSFLILMSYPLSCLLTEYGESVKRSSTTCCTSNDQSMASLPSLSLSFSTRPALIPPSTFKGNPRFIGARPAESRFPSLKSFLQGRQRPLTVVIRAASSSAAAVVSGTASPNVRFRLDNLGPQPGSRKKAKRKGRGISAGQGASCGFGMRGQKSRSGPGVMKGFEGGQMPLYRRIPKLRGIAGGIGFLSS